MTEVQAVVLDIEGTVSPTKSVRALFDYTRCHLRRWLIDNTPGAADQICESIHDDPAAVAEILCTWLDEDIKAKPLKLAQGLVCAQGFRNGDLHGIFYDDVRGVLTNWRDSGIGLHVFSSGSVKNQQDWFQYAQDGEMKSLISGWFDLDTGGKRQTSTYERIAATIGVPPDQILFLSDSAPELYAAEAAGWKVIGVNRPDEPTESEPPFDWVNSLAYVAI